MFSARAMSEAAASSSRLLSFGPPTGGLNARDTLISMPKKDASVLENWVAYPDRLEMRYGAQNHLTGFAAPVKGLWAWNGTTGSKLFGTTDSGVYDVTSAGSSPPAASIALTNGYTHATMINTGAAAVLIMVNGTDTMKQYNGSAWSSISTLGTFNTTSAIAVETYRQRIWMLEKASMNLWYLGANSISGTATSFNLGAIFRRGGTVVSLATWTIDAGTGPDDHLVVVSSEGEVAVFTGSDPAGFGSTWLLKGVYYIGRPLGTNCLLKMGGDLIFLSENGIFPLSKTLQSASVDRTQNLTNKIQPLWNTQVAAYRANTGWQAVILPDVPILLVNVPGTATGFQFCAQLQSGAWSNFSNWNARCFCYFNGTLYYGDTARVAKAWVSSSDFGTNIVATALGAYTTLGSPQQKSLIQVRPIFTANGGFSYTIGCSQEFSPENLTKNQVFSIAPNAAVWGSSYWGQAYWASSASVTKDWRVVPDRPSTYKAIYLQIASSTARVAFQGGEILYQPQSLF